jgi:beta-N-acetylhexosaminidase
MATLGRSGDSGLAERFARALATELHAVGITLDYAPVLDVHTNPKNPVIGDRALADEAQMAAELGAIIVRALQGAGVAACGKLPLIEHPPEQLREREFLPFKAAIAAGVATIMTAHVFIPSLDEERPATLSNRIVTGILREELGFEGVIVSDDLEMKALARDHAVPDSALQAIAAGCDAVLICSGDHDTQAAALERLIREVENDRAFMRRVEDALTRNRRAKERFLGAAIGAPPKSAILRQVLGQDEHRRIADDMARFA